MRAASSSSASRWVGAGLAVPDGPRASESRSRSPRGPTVGAHLVARVAVQFAVFFELFAGAAALSAAKTALAPSARTCSTPQMLGATRIRIC